MEPWRASARRPPAGTPVSWHGSRRGRLQHHFGVLACLRYRSRMFDETLVAEAGRRLSAAGPGDPVVPFGAHARGYAGLRSDLDFLVVEPSVDDPTEESIRLRRTLRGLGLVAD